MSKTIPGDDRVQVVTEPMLQKDAFTIRNESDGTDARIYASEDDESDGIPFRTDDEFAVPEEAGFAWDSTQTSDGLWIETETDQPTDITVLKGVALRRNVRRDQHVTATVTTDTYDRGDAFDFDGSAYTYTVDPAETIQELLITTAGNIVATITTTGGDVFDFPLAGKEGAFNSWEIEKVEFKDPNGTTARIAGGWSGE